MGSSGVAFPAPVAPLGRPSPAVHRFSASTPAWASAAQMPSITPEEPAASEMAAALRAGGGEWW